MRKIFFYVLILPMGFSACDKVGNPYLTTTPAGGGGTHERKLLIEEFTGHKCGSCPPGAQTIQTLQTLHGEKLIAVTIHAGFYATVSGAPYNADYNCNEGNDYYGFFGVSVNPIGMVNRKDFPANTHLKNVGEWATLVDSVLAKAPDAEIVISNTYNSSSRVLTSNITSNFLNSMSGTYNIAVMLIEDSIVSAQKDYAQPIGQQDVLNYVHRHMLRDGITSSWGDALVTGPVAAGDSVVKTFNYTLPANFNGMVPDENHCYVVAYIYDVATYEVIQAQEKKLK